MKMKFCTPKLVLAGLIVAAVAAGCSHSGSDSNTATSDSGAGGASGGGGNAAANPKMAEMRAKFPGTMALMRNVSGIHTLLKSGQSPLTPNQTNAIYAQLSPLGAQQSLPQDAAKKIADALNAALTPAQQTTIGTLRQEQRRNGGQGQGAGGGAGSGGASGAPRANGNSAGGGGKMFSAFSEDTPVDNNPFLAGRAQKMLQDTLNLLKNPTTG